MIIGSSLAIAQTVSMRDLVGFDIGDTKKQVEKSLKKTGCNLVYGEKRLSNVVLYDIEGDFLFLNTKPYPAFVCFMKNICTVLQIGFSISDFDKLRGWIDSLKIRYKDDIEETAKGTYIKLGGVFLLIEYDSLTLTYFEGITKKKKRK